MSEWIVCECCESEFKVISDNPDDAQYCPYCGEPLGDPDESDEDDEFWEEDYYRD